VLVLSFRELFFSCTLVVWCMAPRAPVMNSSGLVFHPWLRMSLISKAYLVSFSVIFSSRNLSLQYVNSMNCIVIFGVDCVGGSPSCRWFWD
jgi:hypothetical protein